MNSNDDVTQMNSNDDVEKMNSIDDVTKIKRTMKAAETHLVVATLLVTVTFAAGFTLPGGFESDDGSPNKGMAILVKKAAFCTFVITDAIAFVCSAGAVFSYFVMAANLHHLNPKEDLRVLENIYRVATILQFLSMPAVVIAFVTGLYATLAHSVGLAVTVCVIGCLSFLIFLFVFFLIAKKPVSKDASD